MDKNIAALLREDAHTVSVSFSFTPQDRKINQMNSNGLEEGKRYKYVTNLQLVEGDQVIVDAAGVLKVVTVEGVDLGTDINPNSDIQYKWVVAKVDMTGFDANVQRNLKIEATVADAYKANLRRSFAEQILLGVDEGKRAELAILLK